MKMSQNLKSDKNKWKKKFDNCKKRDITFNTVSGEQVNPLYTPEDLNDFKYTEKLGFPGQFPFTRGVYDTMYRGRLWTMRMFSGFGSADDTNKRYRYLLEHGQTGLSVAFDFPTLYGRDSDDPFSCGEVGKCGVAISSLADMERLFSGIPLDKVSTSMTINGPAAILWAFYIATAEKQGVASEKLRGTIQNDVLKEYIAQKSWLIPPEPSMRLTVDTMEYGSKNVPKWNTISISGYHIREAGSTAAQELAFTLADGFAYVDAGIQSGLDVDSFAPRLSFFFNSHLDFFEEIAKYRAARRIWAREMKNKYGAKNKRSLLMRFHTQTAGCTLTAQQPENNIVRVAWQALAAVLGGTQSLHTNSMDETLALPSEKAVLIALRTQQLIAHESGAINTIDPLAGSYFVESLTDKMEERAYEYFDKIKKLGGIIKAVEIGYPQKEIAKAAYLYQKEIEEKKRIIVGLNEYKMKNEKIEIPILEVDPQVEKNQHKRLEKLRKERNDQKVKQTLNDLRDACNGTDNLMYPILEATRAYATLGEIAGVLKEVFGEYKEPPTYW